MKPLMVSGSPLTSGTAKLLCRMAGRPDDYMEMFDWSSVDEIEPEREVVVLFGDDMRRAYCDLTAPADSPVAEIPLWMWQTDLLSPTARREVVVVPSIRSLKRINLELGRRRMWVRDHIGDVVNQAIVKAARLYETRL